VAWADKFRFEQTASEDAPESWFYDLLRRTRLLRRLSAPVAWLARLMPRRLLPNLDTPLPGGAITARWFDRIWIVLVAVGVAWSTLTIIRYLAAYISLKDTLTVVGLGFITLARVLVLIAVATVIWVPIGVWIGLRPAWSQRIQPLAQFLAAFPVNLLYPFAVSAIVAFSLDPNIWLSPLIILGTQWYIVFNVIAGASALPNDLKEAADMFHLRSWQKWRDFILPGIFPYYVTGALTASGGSWNASVVVEVVTWGKTTLHASGLGAFIQEATTAGNFPRVALGMTVMSVFVILLNRTLWRPLYGYAADNLRLN
jgi:NitT/TauT family transport system permease protein